MGAMADPFQKISNRIGVKRLALVGAAVLITLLWLYLTPQGLLGKADAIGYAVCHRIDTRSFYLGDRQIPLCARCSGMYLGVLAGFLYQLRLGKRSHFPPKPILVAFGLLGLAFALDGLNSYLTLFPGYTPIYPPNNALRLATGTGLGLLIAVVLMPVVNQTLWLAPVESPLIHRWVQLPGLVIAAGLPAAAIRRCGSAGDGPFRTAPRTSRGERAAWPRYSPRRGDNNRRARRRPWRRSQPAPR